MRLLIVEDQKQLCGNIARYLKSEGYTSDCCYNGSDALDYLGAAEYDAVILDIMLPGIDGLAVLNKMRSSGNKTPVLLLTARSTVEDKVKGLDSGADDYLTKPFSLEELSARIRVMDSQTAVISSSSASLMLPAGLTFVTANLPVVSVPVLSKAKVSTLDKASR